MPKSMHKKVTVYVTFFGKILYASHSCQSKMTIIMILGFITFSLGKKLAEIIPKETVKSQFFCLGR